MKKYDEIRTCKNKDCQKILHTGYKYDLCESCRNKRIEKRKEMGMGVLVVGAAIGLIAKTLTGGKINPKI